MEVTTTAAPVVLYLRFFPSYLSSALTSTHFQHYWPFALGIHRLPQDSKHKGHWCKTCVVPLWFPWTSFWTNSHVAKWHAQTLMWRHTNEIPPSRPFRASPLVEVSASESVWLGQYTRRETLSSWTTRWALWMPTWPDTCLIRSSDPKASWSIRYIC